MPVIHRFAALSAFVGYAEYGAADKNTSAAEQALFDEYVAYWRTQYDHISVATQYEPHFAQCTVTGLQGDLYHYDLVKTGPEADK